MTHATYYATGKHCAVFACGTYVIKIGRIPQHNVDFLRCLPRYRPEIVLYIRDRYIPAFDIVADILVMRRYTPLLHDTDATREAMAHRLAAYIRNELTYHTPHVWGDSTGYNLAYDGQEFVIIDA